MIGRIGGAVRTCAGGYTFRVPVGQKAGMRRSSFAPSRRRRSPMGMIVIIVLVLLAGFIVYLSTIDTEVPTQRVEQDVTNELLGR